MTIFLESCLLVLETGINNLNFYINTMNKKNLLIGIGVSVVAITSLLGVYMAITNSMPTVINNQGTNLGKASNNVQSEIKVDGVKNKVQQRSLLRHQV